MPLIPGTRFGPYEIVRANRRGRNGRGLSRPRHQAGSRRSRSRCCPRRSPHDPERLARFEREAQDAGLAEPSATSPRSTASKNAGGDARPGDGAGRGADAGRAHRARRAAARRGAADRAGRSPTRSRPRTSRASSTAISSRPTSSSAPTARSRCSISAWPRRGAPAMSSMAARRSSPTAHRAAHAATGVILGTAAYMSPEQARGLPVDKRTDIWAFGCVLFEMLTGRAAFSGDTVTDTLAAVLQHEPDWSALPRSTPAHDSRAAAPLPAEGSGPAPARHRGCAHRD